MPGQRERPVGTLRIYAPHAAAALVVAPAWERFLSTYPDVHLELRVDQAPADIVAMGFDAVIGCKEHLATDMVAVRATGPMKKLMRVLEEFSPSSEGFSIGYPSHRQMSAALRAFLDMVRDTHRSPGPAVTNPLQEESGR